MPWSLEAELCAATGLDSVAELRTSQLFSSDGSEVLQFNIVRDWYRAGAETYLLVFESISPTQASQFVIKSCVADPGQSLSGVVDNWLRRRAFVEALGISTPVLLGRSAATLVEEFIPLSLAEALNRNAQHKRLACQTYRAWARLCGAGFMPVSLHDWRSRGQDLVLIDFGVDLGDPSFGPQCTSKDAFLDLSRRAGLDISATDIC